MQFAGAAARNVKTAAEIVIQAEAELEYAITNRLPEGEVAILRSAYIEAVQYFFKALSNYQELMASLLAP